MWTEALRRLQLQLSPQNFEMWLRPMIYASETATDSGLEVRLAAPNAYVRQWFEGHFLDVVQQELSNVAGKPTTIVFVADAPAPAGPPEPAPALISAAGSSPNLGASSGVPTPITPEVSVELGPPESAKLNPKYLFETFVAGPSNQLAFAASQAAATAIPPKYNPVFVCGGVGLGKTHLLHAIGHKHLTIRPDARIVYISSERFMNEYVSAIRSGRMSEFRKRYREGIDVLLVDDVQFLAGKDGTQDEFFHTFNALYDSQKQIVLTADRKPHEISDVADRLRTRFAWGLLADIEPPELEVRLAILRKKAAQERIVLPDDVTFLIATNIKSNVRELEGALIRLAAYASLSNRTIDLAFAQETLGGTLTRPREAVTCESIIKAVASYYGIKVADLKGERRHKSIAGPRAIAMYLSRQHTKDSYPDIGRAFGGKHHTTIISAVEKMIEKLKEDPTLRGEVNSIEAQFPRN